MKKLYVHSQDLKLSAAWYAVAKRIGAVITPTLTDDAVALPLTDGSTQSLADIGAIPVNWLQLLDRIQMVNAGIPTIPAVIPFKIADRIPFSGPIFVKPRRTNFGSGSYAYTRYESVAHFHAIIGADFWAYQTNPNVHAGECIVSPALPAPFQCLELGFTLNSSGALKIIFSNDVTHDKPKHLGNGVPTPVPEEALNLVQTICNKFSVKNAMLALQLVQYEGHWVVMDWHFRPPASFSEGLVADYAGLCDSALAHMLDGHVEDSPFYMEQRSYWKTGIPASLRPFIISLGLLPRAEKNGILGCISGVGESKELVQERFRQFEERACLSSF